MTVLFALWQLSLVLCAVALLALAAMLIVRVIAGRRVIRSTSERKRLTPLLLYGSDTPMQPPGGMTERREAMRLTMELAEMVRGPDRATLLANASTLGVLDDLIEGSNSRVPQERLLAAEALAMFPDVTDRVHEMLDDSNPDVRLGAALALAQNGFAPPTSELVRRLGLGTTERSLLVVSLMRDLAEFDPQGVEAMLDEPDLPEALKLAAIDALADTGNIKHVPLINGMVEAAAEDTALLVRIYRALGRIGHPEGHKAIQHGMGHAAWQVRASAAQAAGASSFINGAQKLSDLLGDTEWWVRFRAGEALCRLGKTGRDKLELACVHGTELAREAAISTLAERAQAL
ncbi:HEAT repeat domain-containing protein [Blastomonas aquatica]|uniref:HEAT repeat domain-containing protein n=1 Tax=Blastomonas aquatica TaxID=1510276 RepID=A0ABQ1JIN9_9SPHN|nr:HEAT repeat domain-containing protein [Blastomonas aquatica]GGB69967.1 hypothetical protein GCM10010833_26520 [Blastomonas aquatica]